jgi:hypothetical protein
MKRFGILGAVLTVGLIGAEAQAVVVDNFDDPLGEQHLEVQSGVNTDQDAATGLNPANTIGGVRDIFLERQSGRTNVDVNDGLSTGAYEHSQGSSATGRSTVTWNAGGQGLGGVDFTEGGTHTQLLIDVLSADLSNGVVTFTVFDTGGGMSTATFNPGVVNNPQRFQLAFGGAGALDFIGNADFTSVANVTMVVDGFGQQNLDIALDNIETGGQIPEPGSVALVVTGAGALLLARFRRRK